LKCKTTTLRKQTLILNICQVQNMSSWVWVKEDWASKLFQKLFECSTGSGTIGVSRTTSTSAGSKVECSSSFLHNSEPVSSSTSAECNSGFSNNELMISSVSLISSCNCSKGVATSDSSLVGIAGTGDCGARHINDKAPFNLWDEKNREYRMLKGNKLRWLRDNFGDRQVGSSR
jgi:hypothetical protein